MQCYTIRDISLAASEVERLFTTYFTSYHQYIPFLHEGLTASVCHEATEMLFWTIISVAAREHQPMPGFLARLAPYFNESIGNTIIGGVMTISDVQALLLLSLYPPYNVRLCRDTSMTLGSLAVSGALHLGLHCESPEEGFTNDKTQFVCIDPAEKARTWLACLSIAQK